MTTLPDDLFFVWTYDDIDSSFYEDTEEPRPLYVCQLCRDTDERADVIRGYDPSDGIFERHGIVLGALGGIDAPPGDSYRDEIERELLEDFEGQRESNAERGTN